VHLDPAREAGNRRRARGAVEPRLARLLVDTLREQQVLAGVERRAIARLSVDAREKPVLVPELEQDIHDLRGLAAFGELVFDDAAPAARRSRGAAS
jgi:hypothetical protein